MRRKSPPTRTGNCTPFNFGYWFCKVCWMVYASTPCSLYLRSCSSTQFASDAYDSTASRIQTRRMLDRRWGEALGEEPWHVLSEP